MSEIQISSACVESASISPKRDGFRHHIIGGRERLSFGIERFLKHDVARPCIFLSQSFDRQLAQLLWIDGGWGRLTSGRMGLLI
jgi:hypothetical protein